MGNLVYLSIFYGLILQIDAYSSGAPTRACESIQPEHFRRGILLDPQISRPPYRLVIIGHEEGTTYSPNQEFAVKLESENPVSGEQFRGFMIEARTVRGEVTGPVGRWGLGATYGSKTICGSDRNLAFTQRFARSRRFMDAKWTAPSFPVGDLILVASVVQNHGTFWMNVTSPILKDGSAITTPPPTLAPTMAAAGNNSQTVCEERNLESLPEVRPGVAILCEKDAHCPCGWVCCSQCQQSLAICRQPRDQPQDFDDSLEIEI